MGEGVEGVGRGGWVKMWGFVVKLTMLGLIRISGIIFLPSMYKTTNYVCLRLIFFPIAFP